MVQFGAVADGVSNNTEVIQKAVDQCSGLGGGTVFFPTGTYMSGTIYLKNNVTIDLEKSSIIKGIASESAYPESRNGEKGFIRLDSVSNVTITGEGTIDGNGGNKVFQKGNNADKRPNLLQCIGSKNIVIKNIHILNSACWTLHLFNSNKVFIEGISIYCHSNWNNDGIDIDSKNVTISNCTIDCDDDALCFKSEGKNLCENIVVTNCNLASNCSLIKFGTSSVTGFKNVTISNCVLHSASESNFRFWNKNIPGVLDSITGISGIALEVVDGGKMEQINISNITMDGIQTPLFIRLGSRKNSTGSLKNVLISNIIATTHSQIPICISGVPGFYIENVIIRDMMVNCMGGGTKGDASHLKIPEKEKAYPENRMFGNRLPAYGMYVRHVKNITLDNIQFYLIKPDYRPAILFDDAQDITLRAFKATQPEGGQQKIIEKNSTVKVLN
jgi:polygalacturonase